MRAQLKNKLGRSVAIALVIVGVSAPPAVAPAQTVFCTNCSNVVTQALQQAAQAEQLLNQIQSYATQIQQYQNMLTNTEKLSDAVFGDAMGDIRKITATINKAKGLAYTASNIEQSFNAKYKSLKGLMDNGVSAQSLQQLYEAWSDDTNDSVLTTFKALGEEAKNIESEAELMEELQSRATTAEGQMQALGVGNELAVQGVAQIQKLRNLQMMQIQMMARELQGRHTKEEAELAKALEIYRPANLTYAGERF